MTISNIGDQYLVLKSPYISDLINDILNYSKVTVSGEINCGQCSPITQDLSFPSNQNWVGDFTTPVLLGSTITNLYLYNIKTGVSVNILDGATINLAPILADCADTSCTIQNSLISFPAFVTSQLENWFGLNGYPGHDITYLATGNILEFGNFPPNFILTTATYNGTSSVVPFTYGKAESAIALIGEGILVSPQFFNLKALVDGIYTMGVKIEKGTPMTSYTEETNCAFVDINMKCKVAAVLQNINKELSNSVTERSSATIHLLHYGLVNGSNCGCNCQELCAVFTQLDSLLTSYIDLYSGTTKVNGCASCGQ